MILSKEEIVKKTVKTAQEYERTLSKTKYLLICKNNKENQIECFEMRFPKYAFQHLTGLSLSNQSVIKSADDFFNACIKGKLSSRDIVIANEANVNRKLLVLPQLINFIRYSKMSVIFNGGRPLLKCDKVVGTTNFCIALNQRNNHYIPVSCLNEDVRNFGNEILRVIAVLSADVNKQIYSNICSVAKGIVLTEIRFPEKYVNVIDLTNYKRNK